MNLNRRKFLRLLGKTALGGAITAVGGYSGYHYSRQIEPDWLDVEQLWLPVPHLAPALEGFKIVQMSDLHLEPFTDVDLIREAVNLTNTLKPDLVAITGDFVLSTAETIFDLAPILARLNPKYGLFTALGNHDIWTDVETVRAGLAQERIPLLENRGVAIDVGQAQLYVTGIDDAWSGQPDLPVALANQPADVFTLLLAHEPDPIDHYSLQGRISLQLSGHTHGGQVRLPGYGALILPPYGQKYQQGLYQVNQTWLYTNRGLGVIWPPVRFNCRPEITEITLMRA